MARKQEEETQLRQVESAEVRSLMEQRLMSLLDKLKADER